MKHTGVTLLAVQSRLQVQQDSMASLLLFKLTSLYRGYYLSGFWSF